MKCIDTHQSIDMPEGNDAKGRNGYFAIKTIETWIVEDTQCFHVDLFSKRRNGDTGPVTMQLTLEGAETLWRALTSMLNTPGAPK